MFYAVALMPGDPPCFGPGMTEAVCDQIRENRGLNESVHLRFVKWMGGVVTGDFGISHARSQSVAGLIGQTLPNTLLLSSVALVLTFGLGILSGVFQATHPGRSDNVVGTGLLFLYSMPSFWLAIMLLMVFSLWLGWLPASGMESVDAVAMSGGERFLDRMRHLVLPAATLTLVSMGGVARFTRDSMLGALSSDYVRGAHARGLPRRRVVYNHGLRSALLPVITDFGLSFPFLFGGAVLVEWVFGWPGMGRLMFEAVPARDMPVIMGTGLLFAGMVIAGNALADALYALADPRIRYDRG